MLTSCIIPFAGRRGRQPCLISTEYRIDTGPATKAHCSGMAKHKTLSRYSGPLLLGIGFFNGLNIMDYKDFIESKTHSSINHGIEPKYLPDCLFNYQRYVSEWAIKKGRGAVFLDTGLGKTLIELVTAVNYNRHTNKPVLIITPLAVAFQFIKESQKFDIGDIEYSKDGSYNSDIVVCNYERLIKFDSNDFDCVILDESSILKNFDGKIKTRITSFLRKVKYRFLFTATPSPNDFVELGTSSEALGYMGHMDMLSKFFTNNEGNAVKPQNIGTKWKLKGHARQAFFKWVSSWSISMRKPSDLGFPDKGFELPELITNEHIVKNDKPLCIDGQMQMFNVVARRLTEIRTERKMTREKRCNKAVELAKDQPVSVYWCNYNNEADLLEKLDSDAIQIQGRMNVDEKEEILLAFAEGDITKLVTKPSMTAFGLNWQHCNHTVYFPTFSYESYYQAIRRFWRFGQDSEVVCDLVYSDGQKRVMDALKAKAKKADELFDKLNSNLNSEFNDSDTNANQSIKTPEFL